MCVRQGYKSDVIRVSREGETDQEEPPELDDDEAGKRGGAGGEKKGRTRRRRHGGARWGREEGRQRVLFLGARGESVK